VAAMNKGLLSNDDDGDDSSGESEVETEAEEKLMRNWARDSDDGDTSSTESEHDSIRMSVGCVRSDHDDSNGDDDFWM
jgi:hypothetical protein